MEIDYTEVFKEIEAISAGLRFSIKHMPRYYRYVLGDRILNILLDIKLMVKLKCKGRNYQFSEDDLYNALITLGTLIDEGLEDKALLLKGKYNIIEPRRRLVALFKIFS